MRHTLEQTLTEALQSSGIDLHGEPLSFHAPNQSDHGDYATAIAFRLAKVLKQAPAQIAEHFIQALQPAMASQATLSQINGFINITLHPSARLMQIATPANYPIKPRRILLEFVSANPTGPLHIGHGRWAVLGSCLAHLLRAVGHTVTTENYINDAGNQIELFIASIVAAKAGNPIPDNGYHGDYIYTIAHCDEDPVTHMLDQHASDLSAIGTHFDHWFREHTLHTGDTLSDALAHIKAHCYTQDSAVWFKSTAFGDDKDRVLVKSDGSLTYFAVDIAYHWNKIQRHYDQLINIWGADHHGYVPRVSAAVQALQNGHSPTELTVIIGQLVSLVRNGEPVRMSKRSGDMIYFRDVIDDIGPDATRFFLIYKSSDSPIELDLNLANQKTAENPIFYIQYAHARICQLLLKVGVPPDVDITQIADAYTDADRPLLQCLMHYPDTLLDAANAYEPHQLANYSLELARHFHRFYETNPVLTSTGIQKAYRLWVIAQVQRTLQTVLGILGISAPTRM
tara:strand:+ start:3078 stop:4610 length:1533 start_codon:yes stop_codon:yes gene_type:complete